MNSFVWSISERFQYQICTIIWSEVIKDIILFALMPMSIFEASFSKFSFKVFPVVRMNVV